MRAALLVASLAACGRLDFDPVGADPPSLSLEVASFETTSSAFTTIPGATFELPPSGLRYLLVTSATLQSTSLDELAAEVRYTVDGVERGMGGTQNTVPDRPGPFQHFVVLEPSAAARTVAFELRDASTGTARIEQLRAYAMPLADDAFYESADQIATTSSATLTPIVTFTPSSPAGEYLFLGLANAHEATGSDCYTRWIKADGTPVSSEMHMPRQPWQSQLMIWRETISPGSSIVFESRISSNTGEVRNVRLLALPTARFATSYSERSVPLSTTTEVIVHDLIPTITASRYLWIASARIEPDCISMTDPSPEKQVEFGGIGVTPYTITHVNDNCAYQTTFGTFELLSAPPSQLVTTLRSGNGFGVRVDGSQIVLLGLDD